MPFMIILAFKIKAKNEQISLKLISFFTTFDKNRYDNVYLKLHIKRDERGSNRYNGRALSIRTFVDTEVQKKRKGAQENSLFWRSI